MSTPVLPTTWYVNDGDSSTYYALLKDETGTFVPGSSLTTLVCWLYLRNSPTTIINSRGTAGGAGQNVKSANGGTVYNTIQTWTDANGDDHEYNFKLELGTADNKNTRTAETEMHALLFQYTFNTTGQGSHLALIQITNNPQVP